MRARIHTAIKKFPEIEATVERLLRDIVFDAFTRTSDCNSADESVAWIYLADQGATYHRISHARLGWDNAPIVEAQGHRCLTGRLWPTLYVQKPVPMVFLPQVRIKTWAGVRRVDMIVAVGAKSSSEFYAVEIIGTGHRNEGDELRADEVLMPVVKIKTPDLFRPDLAGYILERCKAER